METERDDWDVFHDELMEDPATRAAWEARRPAFELAKLVIDMRARLGLTQAKFAKKAGMKQAELARIESMQSMPSYATLARLFEAAGAELEVKFKDQEGKVARLKASPAGAISAPRLPRGRNAAPKPV